MADINISDELVERIKRRINATNFDTVDEYVEFVLSEVVTHAERKTNEPREPTASEEDVAGRLQSLGYLEE